MTQAQKSEVEKAIARAQKYGLVILARGTRKSDGARVWGVTSHSKPGYHLHQVVLIGTRLECDCAARVYCSHRALVHEALTAEREAAERVARETEASLAATRRTVAEMQASSAQRRESSPIARPAPAGAFSIFAPSDRRATPRQRETW